MRIEASNRVVDEAGTVLVDSFWRHDCLVYMALREAGLTHGQAAAQISRHGTGGGPHPRFYVEDELEYKLGDGDPAAEAKEKVEQGDALNRAAYEKLCDYVRENGPSCPYPCGHEHCATIRAMRDEIRVPGLPPTAREMHRVILHREDEMQWGLLRYKPTLRGQLDKLDAMAGGNRSIQAVEATWEDTYLLTFHEAYETGQERYGRGTPEHLAFLEGCLATQSLSTWRGSGV